MWWGTTLMPALRRPRQDCSKFHNNLGYICSDFQTRMWLQNKNPAEGVETMTNFISSPRADRRAWWGWAQTWGCGAQKTASRAKPVHRAYSQPQGETVKAFKAGFFSTLEKLDYPCSFFKIVSHSLSDLHVEENVILGSESGFSLLDIFVSQRSQGEHLGHFNYQSSLRYTCFMY